jgi:hypothetical protein
MIDWILGKIEHYSSKINVWTWQKRWGNRDNGTGYQDSWLKGYKKWKRKRK